MNTYDPADLKKKPKKERKTVEKKNQGGTKGKRPANYGFLMFLAILVFLLGVCIIENADFEDTISAGSSRGDAYIDVLEVHGTMNSDGSDENYDQKWLLDTIDDMMLDSDNKGLLLSIDTPGGSVYTVDELYLKIKEYQDVTHRPVYAYMESMAASGGYYIAAPCDKIYANRNCWTGSIGVTIGTIYDISGFLEDLGVTTVTITAGDNKDMGSPVEKLTKEQKDIYQSLVDEAYEQFVTIVADGREMKRGKAERLADGRIFTAKQAKKNGLIDEISTRDEALAAMKEEKGLTSCGERYFSYEPDFSISSWLYGLAGKKSYDVLGKYDQLMGLMAENQKFTVSYLSRIKK